ncbi:AbrB/MazE/SpoVT family DNA-binding domain-containing protein [Lactiplantibacillus songbeiensis]|uniref:AbrB family toxin-antitoxin system antitoxin n=1 Tax=Lactiplantibacillus songbeiensis TaxID=2559920 RepID=A0ABW4C3M0_9LACO|nr:AbrB family toxin-antitoxin system antitoxin [Lactiplantibacillus songbeiensis]
MVVKARHQGNSTILTIPKSIKVSTDTEFNVYQDGNGNIVYEPVNKGNYDLWSDSQLDKIDYDKLRQEELDDLGYNPREVSPVGKEKTNA